MRGFFKLDLKGDLHTEPSNVDPLEMLVTVVFIDNTLPWPFVLEEYGFPEESVTEIPVGFLICEFNHYSTGLT